MKFRKTLAGLLSASFIMSCLATSSLADDSVPMSVFTDTYFREYLNQFDLDKDGNLSTKEIYKIDTIDLRNNKKVTSVEGINYLKYICTLDIYHTNITSLDLNGITKIQYINAERAPLTYLNLGDNDILHLDLYATKLDRIDLVRQPNIVYLDISETNIEYLNLSKNKQLINTMKTITPVTKTWINKPAYCYGEYGDEIHTEYLSYSKSATVYTECPKDYYNYSSVQDNELRRIFFSPEYDTNGDGFIEFYEQGNYRTIKTSPDAIVYSCRGLDSIPTLQNLTMYNPNMLYFDANMPNLEKLTLINNLETRLKELEPENLDKLTTLTLDSLGIKSFSSAYFPSLTTLTVTNTPFTYANFNKALRLSKIKLTHTKNIDIDLSNNPKLTSVELDTLPDLVTLTTGTKNSTLESLLLTNLPILETLDVSNLQGLKDLRVRECNIPTLDLSNNTELKKCTILHTGVSEVKLGNNSKLLDFRVIDTNVKEIDISGCPALIEAYHYGSQDHRNNVISYTYGYNNLSVSEDIIVKAPAKPTAAPTPTAIPSATPSKTPTSAPTSAPVAKPTAAPTNAPVAKPTAAPGTTAAPTTKPGITTAPGTTTAPSATNIPNKPGTTTTAPAKPTATPTPKPSKPQTGVSDKSGTVEDFAERLYTTCLGRDAEEAGKNYWVDELKAGKPGSEVARGFFFSPEFTGLNLSNEEYITRLYRTFMGREPDKDGMNYWLGEMKNGQGRVFVFDGFVNSPEWADICLTYGIRSGGLAEPTFEKQASKEVLAFAERLYTTCLGRDAEPEGLKYWSQELANLRQTGTVAASGFFNSPEFISLNTSNEEYIARLYRTFMGREPEKAGFDYWMSELKAGKDRQSVFDGFSVAPEFANLCAEAGIMR